MSFIRYASICYPKYTEIMKAIGYVPLSTRSLLIKSCQAQHEFYPDSTAPLAKLLLAAPDIHYLDANRNTMKTVAAIEFFSRFNVSAADLLQSSILLDLLRGVPTTVHDAALFREKGWNTEIQLSERRSYPDLDFFPLFFPFQRPLHDDLPYNPQSAFYIRRVLERFRDSLDSKARYFYPRSTHKNMSRSTRRCYEQEIGGNLAILQPNIFGQDDWQRVYHETGIALGGVVEMRQKWYPSGAKPRTYFAMGGICYEKSRFLQDFFTDLVNAFPSTNQITRLQPHRLRLPIDDSDAHYLVYDLSSFTSNMRQQRSFCNALAEFFRGRFVTVVDERYGPTEFDLGDLLDEYNETCVNGPLLSYERSPTEMGWSDILSTAHLTASLLGIFGNLMTCTLAHFATVSPVVDDPVEQNETAGDDGLTLETLLNRYFLLTAIRFVGDFAPEKLYHSNDEGAVCLKRPLFEEGSFLYLATNIIPPTLVTAISYLLGEAVDDRFVFYDLDEMDLRDRISVVGVDLMRFLTSAQSRADVSKYEEICQVYTGFTNMLKSIVSTEELGRLNRGMWLSYMWPVDPSQYDFFGDMNPFAIYATLNVHSFDCPVMEIRPIDHRSLRYAGDVVKGNSDRRLNLLEKLGYFEKERVSITTVGVEAAQLWLMFFTRKSSLAPIVYTYTCLKDVPVEFLFSED